MTNKKILIIGNPDTTIGKELIARLGQGKTISVITPEQALEEGITSDQLKEVTPIPLPNPTPITFPKELQQLRVSGPIASGKENRRNRRKQQRNK